MIMKLQDLLRELLDKIFAAEMKLTVLSPSYAKKLPSFHFWKHYIVMKQGQKVFEVMANHLFIWTSLNILLMILLDVLKWDVINTEKYQYYQKDNSTWGFQYRPRNP